jgi:hypothetical protein
MRWRQKPRLLRNCKHRGDAHLVIVPAAEHFDSLRHESTAGEATRAGGRVFRAKGERMAASGSHGSDNLQKNHPGVGQSCAGTMHEPEAASDFEFGNRDLYELAAGQFRLNRQAGDQGDSIAAGHESLDGFEAGELDAHVQRRLMASKSFDDALAQGRGHRVGDEILRAELANGDLLLFCQRVLRVHDEDDGVGVDGDGAEAGVLGAEGEHAELNGSFEELIGNLAGEGTLNGDADVRVLAPESVEHGQKPEAGVLISGDGKTAALEGAQFFEGGDGFETQAQEALRITAEELAGGGEGAVARGAFEEGLADFVLQFADSMTDGGLGAAHADSGTGEAFFFKDGEEGFELIKVHKGARIRAAIPSE